MSSLVTCHNVTKVYQEGNMTTQVLKGVSFSIDQDELSAIVGASGSGKSTLLHVLGALDTPTSGGVEVLGQSLATLNQNQQAKFRNQHIGFIYQFHHLLSDFSAIENVAMPLLIAGKKVSIAKHEAQTVLDRVGLSHRLEHRPSELSGGERQRVAIARALINKPALVLADEPTGNLDHQTAVSIYDLMRELNQESQTTFLVVTHDRELAMKMDRQFTMQDGLLV
jgi:lipoprotein-releasing system ATP-binding protein